MSTTRPRRYVRRKGGAIYADVCLRVFDDWLKRGLPHYKVSRGLVLIALDDIDAWLQQFRVESPGDAWVDELVEEVVSEVIENGSNRH